MRFDDLSIKEIEEFKKAEKFYVIYSPAEKQYEVVELDKSEVEFVEYGEPRAKQEPEKYKYSYWFDDRQEAVEFITELQAQDKLIKDLRGAVAQAELLLSEIEKRTGKKTPDIDIERMLE